jgi:hypothetical protein
MINNAASPVYRRIQGEYVPLVTRGIATTTAAIEPARTPNETILLVAINAPPIKVAIAAAGQHSTQNIEKLTRTPRPPRNPA